MQEIVNDLGQFVLGSVPTMILFLLLVAGYHFILYRPLRRTRAERYERTQGAVERAHAAVAAADVKSQEYEAKLRAARAEIHHARELQVQQWNAERETALASARLLARDRTEAAKREIARQAAAAKLQLHAEIGQIAEQMQEAVLPAVGSAR
jgi:F-type H+-transporting ATPase subunit b